MMRRYARNPFDPDDNRDLDAACNNAQSNARKMGRAARDAGDVAAAKGFASLASLLEDVTDGGDVEIDSRGKMILQRHLLALAESLGVSTEGRNRFRSDD